MHAKLLSNESIEWNRLGHFQDITLRLIAERLLPTGHPRTYVQGELICRATLPLPAPRLGRRFHAYCSSHNEGAAELLGEVARARKLSIMLTQELEQIEQCECMLLYLTAQTWTSGSASEQLAEEVRVAMDEGVPVLLAHEMVGAGAQAERGGCEFSAFFSCADGATPTELLQRGIYDKIAVALKGGEWRQASMVLMAQALAAPPKERQTRERASRASRVSSCSRATVGSEPALGIGKKPPTTELPGLAAAARSGRISLGPLASMLSRSSVGKSIGLPADPVRGNQVAGAPGEPHLRDARTALQEPSTTSSGKSERRLRFGGEVDSASTSRGEATARSRQSATSRRDSMLQAMPSLREGSAKLATATSRHGNRRSHLDLDDEVRHVGSFVSACDRLASSRRVGAVARKDSVACPAPNGCVTSRSGSHTFRGLAEAPPRCPRRGSVEQPTATPSASRLTEGTQASVGARSAEDPLMDALDEPSAIAAFGGLLGEPAARESTLPRASRLPPPHHPRSPSTYASEASSSNTQAKLSTSAARRDVTRI